ncbi:MAG: hypothetical protein ACLQU4_07960 [Limisphaerales bacterium]
MKRILKNIIGVLKVFVLLPLWLLILPMRKHHVFRYYSWTLDQFRDFRFTRTAYIFCVACWLVFGWLVFHLTKKVLGGTFW